MLVENVHSLFHQRIQGDMRYMPPLINFYIFNDNMRKNKNDKLYMFVRMNNYCPNGLALVNIHKDISVKISQLVRLSVLNPDVWS